MKKLKREFIGLVEKLSPLKFSRSSFENEIELQIAVLGDAGKPRNFSRSWDKEDGCGGCKVQLYGAVDYVGATYWGPEIISHGSVGEYEHGAKALKCIRDRFAKLRDVRGACVDPVEEMGRLLEVAGVRRVFFRDPQERHHPSSLIEGEWCIDSLGQFVQRIRSQYMPKPETAEAVA